MDNALHFCPGPSSTPENHDSASDPGAPPVFVCRRCGDCCRGQGGVYLDQKGITQAAAIMSITEAELISGYLEPRADRLAVKIDSDGRCLFYSGGCLIHSVKPPMCRAWPFFRRPLSGPEGLQEAAAHCPGLSGWQYDSFLAAFNALGRPLPPA
jgi:Fe-S-cluster containining protein